MNTHTNSLCIPLSINISIIKLDSVTPLFYYDRLIKNTLKKNKN